MKIRYYIIAFIALFMCNTAVFAQERNPNRMVFHKGDKILKTYSVGELDDITFDYVENKEVEISILNVGNNGCKVKFTMPTTARHILLERYRPIPMRTLWNISKKMLRGTLRRAQNLSSTT